MSALRKNVASQVLTFNLVNATTGAALTGATVTTKVALDGTQSSGSGTVTELGTGQYKYVPAQAETNGTTAGFSFTASNAIPVNLHCFTIGQDPTLATFDVNVTKYGGSAGTFTSGKPDVQNVAGNVTGSVGSVTGSVASVTGAVGSVTGNVGGSVASVTGAVGSVTGNVGGNVVGSVASVTGAVGSVTAAVTVGTNNDKTGYTLTSGPLDAAGTRTALGLAAANLDTQLTTIVSDITATDADVQTVLAHVPSGVKKNTALAGFTFLMVDSADHVTGKTGLTVTATRSLDGGAFASCANSVVEIANGFYKIDLAATDTNANILALRFTGTGADTTAITVKTSA